MALKCDWIETIDFFPEAFKETVETTSLTAVEM